MNYYRINSACIYSICCRKNILHCIIIRVCCLDVHRHGPHIWQSIVKIMFQIQTHDLNPVLKSFIHKYFENRNNVNHIWLISKYIHVM
jgi:hypothetical protein